MILTRWRRGMAGPTRGWHPRRRRPGWAALAAAALGALLLVLAGLPRAKEAAPVSFTVAPVETSALQAAKPLPSNICLGLMEGESTYQAAFPRKRLMAGRMMLIDEAHPLPEEAAPPNTLSLLKYTAGRVACRDQQAVLAQDALDALDALFRSARQARINQLVVFAAARSQEQQRQLLCDRMAELSRAMSMEDALAQAKAEIETPGCSEHQLPWCVDIRLCQGWNTLPSEASLADTEAGRWLTAHCWEYGFIRRYDMGRETDASHRAWHFRYVGKAHAAMMHALGLSLEEYLAFLHEHGSVTLLGPGNEPYAAVACRPWSGEDAAFALPLTATVEDASVDNTGYALVACLYPAAD